MSYLTYNGIKMQAESFQRFDQQAIYSEDGVDYECTQFTIVIRSLWTTATNSLMGGLPPASTAATTMDAIRKTLLTPRKPLVVQAPVAGFGEADEVAGTVFLRSPLLNPGDGSYSTDARNGPQPLFCNIQQIIGEETMIVDFGITTWINECPGTLAQPISPILSHRWSMAHYMDEMQHCKRVIAGTVVLRSDLLYDTAGNIIINADDFRDYLFHNIPPNFRRIGGNVQASSDGTRLQYTIEDQEVDGVLDRTIHNITEVAHIEGTYSEAVDAAPGVSLTEAINNIAAGAAIGGRMTDVEAFGSSARAPGAIAGAAAAAAATLAAGSFPGKTFEVVIRVQGTRRSARVGLVRVAILAAAGFNIGSLGQQNVSVARRLAELFLVSNSIQISLVEKWVQLRLTYRSNGISSYVHQFINSMIPGSSQTTPTAPNQGPNSGPYPPGGPNFGGDSFIPPTPRPGLGNVGEQTQVFTAITDTPGTLPISALGAATTEGGAFPDFLRGVTKSNGTPFDSYGPRGGTLNAGLEKGSRGATIAHIVTAAFGIPCSPPTAPKLATASWNLVNNPTNTSRVP